MSFLFRVETQQHQNIDFDNFATSPPGDGCFSFPEQQSAWFIGNDSYNDPGPAVHTLNVFINAKKGGNSDDELDRQFTALSVRHGRSFRLGLSTRTILYLSIGYM